MKVYFVRDTDPQGGFFAVYEAPPVMSDEKKTIVEVRKGNFPKQLLADIYHGGIVEAHPQYYYDEYIIPHWDEADIWWTRDEGYVATRGGNK